MTACTGERALSGDGCLSEAERRLLLRVARQALASALELAGDDLAELSSAGSAYPALQALRAVFVTLWRRDTGELCGCRGECLPTRPLVDAVAAMACAAAFDDERFRPVAVNELPHLCIEISVLSPLAPIRPDNVKLGRHGLLIVACGRRGLLLPQVPIEHGMNREQFLAALCRKAGLPEHAWQQPGVELLAFETETWKES